MLFMIITVNDQIRQAVRVELAKKDMKQVDLAKEIGVSKQYLNVIMRGKAGGVPETWLKIFDKLGLELVVKPKEGDNS